MNRPKKLAPGPSIQTTLTLFLGKRPVGFCCFLTAFQMFLSFKKQAFQPWHFKVSFALLTWCWMQSKTTEMKALFAVFFFYTSRDFIHKQCLVRHTAFREKMASNKIWISTVEDRFFSKFQVFHKWAFQPVFASCQKLNAYLLFKYDK